ncbi:CBS domain-containing protein [Desulfopila inferna]|uniref:CBS domain-containing protein n=1 Tax=Desulfopila inferna TaxID=468528 RepID=UPI0019634441|nr:CBS domain-containing protein [Desulfopila inferna]MBM9605332.1 CBS domain-containing protein [Desulfopila inferna]
MKEVLSEERGPLEISEQDVLEAMKRIPGYLDITPGDFKEIYKAAYALAIQRLLTDLKAVNIMTTSVVVVDQEMALVDAAALLAEKQISGAPVVNRQGILVGVVSEKDFLKEMGFGATPSFMQIATHCLNDRSCMIGRLHNRTIGDIMSRPPISGAAEMTVGAISSIFADKQINRLPIVDADQRLIGMVTRTDLAHSLNVYQEKPKK